MPRCGDLPHIRMLLARRLALGIAAGVHICLLSGAVCHKHGSSTDDGLLNVLVMADIGHPREYQGALTSPYPMEKCADEGSFSLFDGLGDYVVNQGIRPQAAFVLGDVSYVGGDAKALNETRSAFNRYMGGHLSDHMIFPAIGNHDVNYYGCVFPVYGSRCYYGASIEGGLPTYEMSFQHWRENWLANFPGLKNSALTIRPPPSPKSAQHDQLSGGAQHDWLAPLRYNVNLDNRSSVYFIIGLISGSDLVDWNDDTPADSADAMSSVAQAEGVECAFLRDSLSHGRSLGKTVFIYMTHHIKNACQDWSLLQQVDVWMYGHKHLMWQSPHHGAVLAQEQQYYPVRLLLGNGGFDEGLYGAVSFVHVQEAQLDGDRVRLSFDILDTCVGGEPCPSSNMYPPQLFAHCWHKCKNFTGGYDSGGGPRKAINNTRGFGFVLDAPRQRSSVNPPRPPAPFGGSWNVRLGNGTSKSWIGTGDCNNYSPLSSIVCLVPVDSQSNAAVLAIYDAVPGELVSMRLAVVDDIAGPVVRGPSGSRENWLYRDKGFWHLAGDPNDEEIMRPTDGWNFKLKRQRNPSEGWLASDLAWRAGGSLTSDHLIVMAGSDLEVTFHDPPLAEAKAPSLKRVTGELLI
eukprot:gnl/TRDRNA2_/TRDRNA2_174496_c0_seq2.p1 gnl/TRDRNA2_/TRDRNA2_174496_c0~~gnl/TRDRNA2_/TRDRNA2_174496_c0_seq2.p1  ORF type:complete len:628 (+),score=67.36 gnl/TRDRNA2_/TRDRNA2_174496_c0_seq2:70-1953(+)